MPPLFQRLATFAALLTFVVIVLGAWVRLTDAGLGCPDWPGCYGRLAWPSSSESVESASLNFPDRPVDSGKALREMVHRYVAGFLGLVVLGLAVMAWRHAREPEQPVVLPTVLLGLIVFQALLGMWTVTLLLKPAVVMAHLLGGMATFALLVWLALRSHQRHWQPTLPARRLHGGVIAALIVVIVQIALGGWVSANYAALSCGGDFPACLDQWWPETDFLEGFIFWREIGIDYEGGVLDQPARTAIHLAHRIGALVVAGVVGWLAIRLLREQVLYGSGIVLTVLLIGQITLGILNVTLGLPRPVAVAHNGGAALLLAMLIYLLHRTMPKRIPRS